MERLTEQLRAVLLRDGAGLTDGQLLACFIAEREEAAFEALMRRHGPMVLAVCRRILHNFHDSEDAFQATFLVLARKAVSVTPPERVGDWLHGVAYRTALKAKKAFAKRHRRERQLPTMPEPEAPQEDTADDLRQLLDRELNNLPEKYRLPLVLCGLEEKTEKEAARQLGWPQGTLSGRLSRARTLLEKRLARRGTILTAGSIAATLSQGAGSGSVPTTVLASTAKAATAIAAGGAAASIVSGQVAALSEGMVKAMFIAKVNIAASVLLLALCGFGTTVILHEVTTAAPQAKEDPVKEAPARQPAKAAEEATNQSAEDGGLHQLVQNWKWRVTAVDDAAKSIDLQLALVNEGSTIALHLTVAHDAEVVIDARKGTLADLRPGMQVTVHMAKDRATITRLEATGFGRWRLILKRIDIDKRSITVGMGGTGGQEWTAPLATDAKIMMWGEQGKHDAQLSDLKAGISVQVELAREAGKIVVKSILGSGQ